MSYAQWAGVGAVYQVLWGQYSGQTSDEMFMRFSQKYETERLELKEKISAYRKRLSEVDEMQLGKEKFIVAVRKFMQMDKLTAPLLQELIDRIDLYEVTGIGKKTASRW